MTRKRSDDLKALAGSWLDVGGADEPTAAEPTPKRSSSTSGKGKAAPAETSGPVILASDKSRTPGGLLRRTTYFTPAEWGAVLERAEAETRETGKLVTAAEIIRRAVWDYLVRDLDA